MKSLKTGREQRLEDALELLIEATTHYAKDSETWTRAQANARKVLDERPYYGEGEALKRLALREDVSG